MRVYLCFIPITLCVTGCAHMNNNFDCPNKAGVNCMSLDKVNDKVNQGILPASDSASSTKAAISFAPYPLVESFHQGDPIRYGERVQRIWVAPFVDTNDNYHQASISYEVIDPGHWIGSPVKAVKE